MLLECRTEVRMRGGTFLCLGYGDRFAKKYAVVWNNSNENIIYLVKQI